MKGTSNVLDTRKNGFSLIEIIIVIAIVGIIAAIALPAMNKWIPNYRLKAAALELYSSMQLAKGMAVKANRNVGMEFFPVGCPPEGGSYRFFIDDDTKDNIMNGTESAFLTVTMPAGVCLSATTWGSNRGGFTAQGVASTAGKGDVTLGHIKTTRTYTVSVLVSGGVNIK